MLEYFRGFVRELAVRPAEIYFELLSLLGRNISSQPETRPQPTSKLVVKPQQIQSAGDSFESMLQDRANWSTLDKG